MRHLNLVFATVLAALAGCATAPSDNAATIASIRTITVMCCDFKNEVNVLPETKATMTFGLIGAVSGGALGAVGVSAIAGGVGLSRTNGFYDAAGEKPMQPHQHFIDNLKSALSKHAIETQILVPRFYDGYQDQYVLATGEATGNAILELRYIANIANTDDRFFPSIAVGYRLLTNPGRKELSRGLIGSSDAGVEVAFGDKRPFSAPTASIIARQGGINIAKAGVFIDLPANRVVVGNSSTLNANAKKMYSDVLITNIEVANRLASTLLLK